MGAVYRAVFLIGTNNKEEEPAEDYTTRPPSSHPPKGIPRCCTANARSLGTHLAGSTPQAAVSLSSYIPSAQKVCCTLALLI